MGIFWFLMGAGVLLYCVAVRLRAGRMAFMRLVAAGGGLALLAGIWRILSPAGMLPRILSGLGLAALFALLTLEAANLLRIRALPQTDAAPDCTVVLGCGLRGGLQSVWLSEPAPLGQLQSGPVLRLPGGHDLFHTHLSGGNGLHGRNALFRRPGHNILPVCPRHLLHCRGIRIGERLPILGGITRHFARLGAQGAIGGVQRTGSPARRGRRDPTP